jgi:hypothetical protein
MNTPVRGALDSSPRHPPEGYADGKQINKEGRHVGLDFYDLLIEGDYTNNPTLSIGGFLV